MGQGGRTPRPPTAFSPPFPFFPKGWARSPPWFIGSPSSKGCGSESPAGVDVSRVPPSCVPLPSCPHPRYDPREPWGAACLRGVRFELKASNMRGRGAGSPPRRNTSGGGGVNICLSLVAQRVGRLCVGPPPRSYPPRDSVFPPLGRSGAGRGRRAGPLPPGALPRRPAASCRRNARRYAPVSSSGSPSLAGAERRIYHPVAAVHLPCSFVTAYEGKLSVGNSPLLRSRLRRGSSHLEEASLPRRTPHAGRELRRASRRCYAPLPPPGAPGASSFPPPPFLRLRRLRAPPDEPPRHPAAGPEGLCLPGSRDPPPFPGRPRRRRSMCTARAMLRRLRVAAMEEGWKEARRGPGAAGGLGGRGGPRPLGPVPKCRGRRCLWLWLEPGAQLRCPQLPLLLAPLPRAGGFGSPWGFPICFLVCVI